MTSRRGFGTLSLNVTSGGVQKTMTIQEQLQRFIPCDEQETADLGLILDALYKYPDIFERSNQVMHMTASSWIINPSREKVLMIYHNIYDSWAWTGGHADGERDLCLVAEREAREETGLSDLNLLLPDPISVEILTVNSHIKHGCFVPSHLHLNVTYLFMANDQQAIRAKTDENKAVAWFGLDDAVKACSEPWMRPIYAKLNRKVLDLNR